MGAVMVAAEGLIRIMEETLLVIEKLNLSAKQKRVALAESDIDGLNGIVEQEVDLITTLREKEKERISKSDELSAALGVSGTNLTLKALIKLIDDSAVQSRLADSGEKTAKAVEQLAYTNSKFKEHLQQQIDYTDFMLNLLISPRSQINSYDIQGNVGEGKQEPSLLEYRA